MKNSRERFPGDVTNDKQQIAKEHIEYKFCGEKKKREKIRKQTYPLTFIEESFEINQKTVKLVSNQAWGQR